MGGERLGPSQPQKPPEDEFDFFADRTLDPNWGKGAPPIEPSVTEVQTDDFEAFENTAVDARISNVEMDYRRFPDARKIAEVREGVEGAEKGWGWKKKASKPPQPKIKP